jgi:acetylornithine deacetylase/succinyl-diaminopimelate desuccinylase-like protein
MSISSARDDAAIYHRPAELLQRLVRFNTTNAPGNEAACISYINQLLTEAGFSTTILAADPERPNLIARLQGQGNAPPLLLQGHVDVVTTEKQVWQQPPFAGNIVDDYVWGRGTLDMKGGVAMMIAAFMRAGTEAESLPGDVILAVLSDEEAGGDYGAKYLVENHADIFKGTRYALGEFGGYTVHIAGKKFYPIQVLEKQVCWMKAIVRGPGGHGSLPMHGGATAKLAQMLQQLDRHRLPVHITPIPRQMLEEMSAVLPDPIASLLRQLLDPAQTDQVLDRLGPLSQLFDPILHNTVNVTIIQGGNKINVIPSEIVFEMDGRLLPGYTADDMVKELRSLLGNEVELELVRYDEGRSEADMGLYDTLATILSEADPEGIAVPLLMPAVTDGRFFSRLGIQTYGFLPMSLPADFNFLQTIHAADERIPVEAVEFGTRAIYEVLKRNKA